MRKTIYILLTFVLLASTMLAANDQQKQRPQIWDFGAVSFDRTKYENMLTTGEINGWMPAAIPGSANAYISDFLGSKSVNLSFNGHGGKTHRLRTTNTNRRCTTRSMTPRSRDSWYRTCKQMRMCISSNSSSKEISLSML